MKHWIKYSNKKYTPGDEFPIFYRFDQIVRTTSVITYYDNQTIYTCGHCFAENAETPLGKLTYSSGFDTPDEGLELAIIKVNNPESFDNLGYQLYQEPSKPIGQQVILLHNGEQIKGKVIDYIENKSQLSKYNIETHIDKLVFPYYLIRGIDSKLETKHGYSGSPWIYNGKQILGGHIGKAIVNIESEQIEVSYAKPIIQEIDRIIY